LNSWAFFSLHSLLTHSTIMLDHTPLCQISSTVCLNSFQKEEFTRVSELYHKVYQYLLLQWYAYAEKKPLAHVGQEDFKFISQRLCSLIHHVDWIEEDCVPIATFAFQELFRSISEQAPRGKPPAHRVENPIEKRTDEVVFYRDYDIRVKQKLVRLPVIGKANIGRFSYFTGSIRAVSVRTDANGEWACSIYYKENKLLFEPKDPSVWRVGASHIRQSPLNLSLVNAGVGFMI
jgi:hypothetical protein